MCPSAQAFLDSARAQGPFQPMPLPPLQLSAPDQARIRDRSTIMARHLFADRGDAFADEQAWPNSLQHFLMSRTLFLCPALESWVTLS